MLAGQLITGGVVSTTFTVRVTGWPEVYGSDHGRFTAPLKVYEEAVAPSGATRWSKMGVR